MGRHGRSTPVRRAVHRKQGPARAGLLSASAALTIGAMAIGTGVLPSPGDTDDQRDVAAHEGDRNLDAASAAPDRDRDDAASRAAERDKEPEASESPAEGPDEVEEEEETDREEASESADPEPDPEPEAVDETPETVVESEPASPAPSPDRPAPPSSPPSSSPATPSSPPQSDDPAQQAAARVLGLVNEERARAGCRPLTHDGSLAVLAQDFSRDMAERDFFDHTDPDGRSPWDRADRAGISNLGGENIARGQQSAESVMESWMNSEGHRANILNCDFKTLGVGVHIGPGGPWWTQNFGY
ncbi:CAP domain-containing protein [Streptomyces lonarensis]|uniref:CAP domain-containing protein n=1 Tax=Streptomyces lonarensis TaxID=700599 RepID=A0A7X6CXV4_9ACTN|nr:CAP domain-containing protein [Streptomyces lonarensis]NJQ04542.1 CAP domain-containing protein [Streptomyces lonarensis]